MSGSFNPFFNPGNSGNKAVFHILAIATLMFMCIKSINAQSESVFKPKPQISESILFSTNPRLENLSFRSEKYISDFNANKSFNRVHISDLDYRISNYPNPTAGSISAEIPESGELNITSATGMLVSKHKFSKGTVTLDLSGLPSGVYIFQYFIKGETYLERIILDK